MTSIKINKLIRTKRKTLCLQITHDANLIIRAPIRMPMEIIEQFILQKQHWIEKKQESTAKKINKTEPKKFNDGEKFLYLGESYPLAIVEENYIPLSFEQEFKLSRIFHPQAKQIFLRWYKNEAHKIIEERLKYFSLQFNLKYNKFKISNAKTRWGSCTAQNNLTFSWRLVMAPSEIIDYVIAHELTHLIEKNHSKRFWDKLSTFFPKFKECRHWLKENEHTLCLH